MNPLNVGLFRTVGLLARRRSTCGAVLLGLALSPPPVLAQAKWTLGSPSTLVQKIQGQPAFVERLVSLGYEVWHFGGSWVRLGYADDRVVGWFNAEGALKVELRAGADTTRERTFAAGSTLDDVVRLQGTPSAATVQQQEGLLLLGYGQSVVRVTSVGLRVVSWDDSRGELHARGSVAGRGSGALGGRASLSTGVPRASPPARPLTLSTRFAFIEPGGDDFLDAEEQAAIEAIVRNDGPGTARDVKLAVTTEQPTPGVEVGRGDIVDSILPGRSATLRAAVQASAAIRDGQVFLHVAVREANGFDLDPAGRVVVQTRALRVPRLALGGIGINDQSGNGRIEPREIVDVVARIRNAGEGAARDVRVTVLPGPDVLLTPESPREIALGVVRAGETRDIRFGAFANSRASAFGVSLAVREARPRFDTTLVLPLALDRPIASVPDLVVRGRDQLASAAPPSLVSDVDTGIPRAPLRANVVAVVLGVERYQRAPPVQFARRDAAVFREYAMRVFGVGDDASRLYFRTDDEVTAGEFRKVFGEGGWLARRVDSKTDVVVYFAGHGVADLKTHAPYLLPNDADPSYPAQTGYALAELYGGLAALGARSVTIFVDACFSGGTRDGAPMVAGTRGVVVSVEHPALRSESMAVFTAAGGDEVASAWPERRHGVFTYWLLKGLRGAADTDGDGALTVAELDRFVGENVPRTAAALEREQRPATVARNKSRVVARLR